MNDKDFIEKIKFFKKEITNLKQQQEYGLNRTNFYINYIYKQLPESETPFYKVRYIVEYDTDSNIMPFSIIDSDLEGSLSYKKYAAWNPSAKTYTEEGDGFMIFTAHMTVISISPIKNITLEFI